MIQTIAQQTGASLRQVCTTLEVPRSNYYHAAKPTPTQASDAVIGTS